jgi:hypothetical protein
LLRSIFVILAILEVIQPIRRRQSSLKKKGKAGLEIKKEIKKDIKEAVDKRLRCAGSVEPNTPAKRLPIGQPNAATRARGMEQAKEEELLHARDDVEDDLPPLEQVMRPSRRK